MKYIILVDLEVNGQKLEKGKTYDLPWQIGERFVISGWAKPVKDGGEGDGTKIDNATDDGTGKSSRGKKASESV